MYIKGVVMNAKTRTMHLLVGPALFAICYFFLPDAFFDTSSSRGAIGTIAWMAYWWITGPVDFAVTGFMPLVLNAIFQMADMKLVISNYAD